MWAFTWTIQANGRGGIVVATSITSELESMGDRAPTSIKEFATQPEAQEYVGQYIQGGDTLRIFDEQGTLLWQHQQTGSAGY